MKSALFAGSFDPPTFGHLDIIERAAKFFDRLIIGIASNHAKKSFLQVEDRLKLLQELTKHLHHVEIKSYSGLTANFAKDNSIQCLIRSIRSEDDSLQEIDLARSNAHLANIETWLLPANEKYAFISSSIVREIALNNGSLSEFVPGLVAKHLQKMLAK